MHSLPVKQAKLTFKAQGNDPELHKKFNNALVDHISESHTSFSKFGSQSFRNLINVANEKLTVPHPTIFSRMVSSNAKTVLSQVRDIMLQ